ncbi:amyloid protein-binding protein 2 [Anthonomus grandis grandis]|uniref:amyloid protein-binding protein 2 n=1 Tax=Anthonomus grandis grandis TaxID=2921223 RepID=UPI002164FCF2|nr:amyloid protein-binding protein 2 [Anthonomus grandis grandis]
MEVKSAPTLYNICLNALVTKCTTSMCSTCKNDFRLLPNTALCDFYERLFQERRLCFLAKEFSNLDIFNRLLYVKGKRHFLICCYQALLNHDENLSKNLLSTFQALSSNSNKTNIDLIDLGLQIGSFMNDGGWYLYSIKFLNITEQFIKEKNMDNALLQLLECYRLKLNAESLYCEFSKAAQTFNEAQNIIRKLEEIHLVPSLAGVYCTFSTYHFVRSNFDESYEWAIKGLKLLPTGLPNRTILEVLRQSSKACVIKRKFMQADLLITQAKNLGEMLHNQKRLPTFSNILMDYGFFLLNSDAVSESVSVYEEALKQRIEVFDSNNIQIALAHEDLAYSLYVNEYSSGNFWQAKENAENSIKIMEKILPKDHLLLASVKRVQALILEEIALDDRSQAEAQQKLLTIAEKLHISALSLSQEFFGITHVQTAKHYGNLGRLYQTMKQFERAEQMHLKAIEIKQQLLGPYDYEVGLSIGHLASLYNYHMKKYIEAERLYLRSIEINIRLFGPAYSGLEYDYRGLINVYNRLVEPENALFYNRKFREWRELRSNIGPVVHNRTLMEPKEILKIFFEIEEEQRQVELSRATLVNQFRQAKENQRENVL